MFTQQDLEGREHLHYCPVYLIRFTSSFNFEKYINLKYSVHMHCYALSVTIVLNEIAQGVKRQTTYNFITGSTLAQQWCRLCFMDSFF